MLNLIENLKEEKLVGIELYNKEECNSFQRFLIDDRVWNFQKLLILEHYFEAEVRIGYDKIEGYKQKGQDNWEFLWERRNVLITTEYTGEQMFNRVLHKLNYKAVEIPFYPLPELQDSVDEEGPIMLRCDRKSHVGETIILLDPFIVLRNGWVYVEQSQVEKIKGIIDNSRGLFEEFIKNQADMVGVDHAVYVDWLHRWFPTKVNFRTLTN